MKTGLTNAVLRLLALGSRFVLAMYMARYMTLRDVGEFSLLTGLVGFLPSLTGMGMNYFVARQLVSLSTEEASELTFDRIIMSIVCSAVICTIIYVIYGLFDVGITIDILLIITIVILEVPNFDLQMMMLARMRSGLANLLLFFRTGAWVFPYIFASYFLPDLRSLTFLALFWIAGLLLAYAVAAIIFARYIGYAFRNWTVKKFPRLVSMSWAGKHIWASDLGLAAGIYSDRFIIASMIDVKSAGTYFFFSSIANSIYVICSASTVQVYAPMLRRAFLEGGAPSLQSTVRKHMRSTAILGFVAVIAAIPGAYAAVLFTEKQELMKLFYIVPPIFLAYAVKLCSDLLGSGMAAAEKDLHFAGFNLLGLVLMALISVVAIPFLGIAGAAVGLLSATLAVLVWRVMVWRQLALEPHATVQNGA